MLSLIAVIAITTIILGLITYIQARPTKLEKIGFQLGIEVEII